MMNIYTDDPSESMIHRIGVRLLQEGNSKEQVLAWSINTEVLPLSEFDISSGDYGCVESMLADGKVDYIVSFEDSNFVYVGVR